MKIKSMNNEDYKVGDITPAGYEVMAVDYRPQYKMRKRIRVTADIGKYKGELGYYYFESAYDWVELDNGKILKLLEREFEFIENED